MTTFTITCPPTVAAITKTTVATFSSKLTNTEIINNGAPEGYSYLVSTKTTRSEKTDLSSNIFIEESVSEQENGRGPECGDDFFGEAYVNYAESTTALYKETYSWDGGRTIKDGRTIDPQCPEEYEDLATDTEIVWTATPTTSSQITTTKTDTVYSTTVSSPTNVSTRTGTLVTFTKTSIETNETAPETSVLVTITDTKPTTTITNVQGFTTSLDILNTTRVTTTTKSDTFNKWRSTNTGATHRGTYQEATVVVLETSNLWTLKPEVAWIVTNRPDFTQKFTNVASQQDLTQFTVYPSFITTAGHVEEASTEDEGGVIYTFSTSSYVSETPTTYTTTTAAGTAINVALLFTEIPHPLNEQIGTTLTTTEYFSTIYKSLFTGGDTSTTTIVSTTTFGGRIGSVTWNETYELSTTVITSYDFETAYTFSTSTEFINDFGASETNGQTHEESVTFERPINLVGSILQQFIAQNQCGSSLSLAVGAASNETSFAQAMSAGDLSVKFPPLINIARTARTPLGSWTYETNSTTIIASAGPAGLSITSSYGPTSSITTISDEALWNFAGNAVSRANLASDQRINLGGRPPIGSATAFYHAGVFSTSDNLGSGTFKVTTASTNTLNSSGDRTAYLPASNIFITGGARYSTTARNITNTIDESALITNRSQVELLQN